MWGGESGGRQAGANDRGPTSPRSAAGPPQEPPEGKRLPGAEGPPEAFELAAVLSSLARAGQL